MAIIKRGISSKVANKEAFFREVKNNKNKYKKHNQQYKDYLKSVKKAKHNKAKKPKLTIDEKLAKIGL